MKQAQHSLTVSNRGRGMTNITREVQDWVSQSGFETGLLNLFVQHTSIYK